MSSKPRYVTFKDYAGFVVRGVAPVVVTTDAEHMKVAAMLTAQMEAANWGTVQSYDGAGISAGPLHNIAVQPRDLAQGSLWALLSALPDASFEVKYLLGMLKTAGFVLSPDGKLRTHDTGRLVDGRTIRTLLNSSPDGKTPKSGEGHERAKQWALAFHEAFSDPLTWEAQVRYAVKWLCEGRAAEELEVYRRFVSPQLDSPIGVRVDQLPPAVDLAMCVYHSFSANGPSPAAKILARCTQTDPRAFAKALVRGLGKSDFGRWHDDPDDKTGRYDHTRKAVIATGLWSKPLVDEIMPRNL